MSYYLFVSFLMILSLIFYSTKLFMEGDWMAGVAFTLVLVGVTLLTLKDFKNNKGKERNK